MKNISGKIHPLMAGAAVSVILVSLLGAAAITGVLPTSKGNNGPSAGSNDQMTVTPVGPNGQALAPNGPPNRAPYGAQAGYPNYAGAQNYAAVCTSCGHVESINAVQHQGKGSGAGVVAGALIGGVLGNQVGGGRGRTLATVAGAVGGGYAGNEIERRANSSVAYQVRVKTDDGKLHTYHYASQPPFAVGQPVMIENGSLVARADNPPQVTR